MILLRSNFLWYPFIYHFNEQPVLHKNLKKIISLEATLLRCFAKYVFLKVFCKFTGKHLCRIFIFNKATSWKISQNSKENTYTGASFLVKLQAEKICKSRKKTPLPESRFWWNCRLGTISTSNCWSPCAFLLCRL